MTSERPAEDELDTPEQIYGRLITAAGTLAATAGDASEGDAPPNERRVLAVIWATVDRDRVLADLDVAAERLAEDPHLGASVTLVRPADGHPIAILEPVTEGRLAAQESIAAGSGLTYLGVFAENDVAQRLYARLGFMPIGGPAPDLLLRA